MEHKTVIKTNNYRTYIAKLDIDTIDIGVPVLSMHAPYELVAKADVWSAYRAFKAFLES